MSRRQNGKKKNKQVNKSVISRDDSDDCVKLKSRFTFKETGDSSDESSAHETDSSEGRSRVARRNLNFRRLSSTSSSGSSSRSSSQSEDSSPNINGLTVPKDVGRTTQTQHVQNTICADKVTPEKGDVTVLRSEHNLKPAAKQRKPQGKQASNKKDDSDLDDLLLKLAKAPPRQQQPNASTPTASNATEKLEEKVSGSAPTKQEEKLEVEENAVGLDDCSTTVSAKTLKNRQKKLKKKNAAAASEADKTKSQQEVANASKNAGPMSLAARLAQKRRVLVEAETKRLEEERLKQEEEERQQREAEEEEQRRIQERKEKKREARQEAKVRQRREGKPVTNAEKERARRAEAARELLLEQMNHALSTCDAMTTKNMEPKSRVVVSKKKRFPVSLAASAGKVAPAETLTQQNHDAPTGVTIESTTEVTTSPQQASHDDDDNAVVEPAQKTFLDISDWEKSDDSNDNNLKGKSSSKIVDEPLPPCEKKCLSPKPESLPISPACTENVVMVKSTSSTTNATDTVPPVKGDATIDLTHRKTPCSEARLRSPICCILGHVDTGKTKLLDKIRHTDVQAAEAGGITQQIGATFFPRESLIEQCRKVGPDFNMQLPGLLIIDTPGHESFNNLRSRGSSLCDIAILVIDIMHGLEPQTRESLDLLKARKCPFLLALNKIDRLYGWKSREWEPVQNCLKEQEECTQQEFQSRLSSVLLQLAETGLNCGLWWEIDNVKKVVSVVPTSAITAEGIPDLLYLLVNLTQSVMTRSLTVKENLQCTILEVKAIEGLGTTVDVILVSGILYVNDKLVVCGMSGPIVTNVRALLTPQPLKELRVKGEYIHHKEIVAAQGVKICAPGLEEAVAGTSLLVARDCDDDELEVLKENIMADMNTILSNVNHSGVGVYVMASTLGSLEALLQFLKTSNIPVFAVNIGCVHKLDVKKASVIREKGYPEYSCILAFDVRVDPDATKEAQTLGVKIFTADIIYHLFDSFTQYVADINEQKKKEKKSEAVFPCILSIYPNCIFNKKDPIVLGVKVEEGICKVGTPLCIPDKDKFFLGRVGSLEHNKKPVETAKRGEDVAIKIMGDSNVMYGRHFDHTVKIYSRITRESIDCLKEYYRDDLKKDDWKLIVKMKKCYGGDECRQSLQLFN